MLILTLYPGLSRRSNPGLKLANAFGVYDLFNSGKDGALGVYLYLKVREKLTGARERVLE